MPVTFSKKRLLFYWTCTTRKKKLFIFELPFVHRRSPTFNWSVSLSIFPTLELGTKMDRKSLNHCGTFLLNHLLKAKQKLSLKAVICGGRNCYRRPGKRFTIINWPLKERPKEHTSSTDRNSCYQEKPWMFLTTLTRKKFSVSGSFNGSLGSISSFLNKNSLFHVDMVRNVSRFCRKSSVKCLAC